MVVLYKGKYVIGTLPHSQNGAEETDHASVFVVALSDWGHDCHLPMCDSAARVGVGIAQI